MPLPRLRSSRRAGLCAGARPGRQARQLSQAAPRDSARYADAAAKREQLSMWKSRHRAAEQRMKMKRGSSDSCWNQSGAGIRRRISLFRHRQPGKLQSAPIFLHFIANAWLAALELPQECPSTNQHHTLKRMAIKKLETTLFLPAPPTKARTRGGDRCPAIQRWASQQAIAMPMIQMERVEIIGQRVAPAALARPPSRLRWSARTVFLAAAGGWSRPPRPLFISSRAISCACKPPMRGTKSRTARFAARLLACAARSTLR